MSVFNITGCLFGCDCERCTGWLLAPGQEDARQLLRGEAIGMKYLLQYQTVDGDSEVEVEFDTLEDAPA